MESAMTDTLETGARSVEKRSVSSQTFPADKTAPRAATSWLRSLHTGLSASRLADAELCLDEIVTNVVRYAWSDGGAHTLTVSVERAGGDIEIAVEDEGSAFDPTAAPLAPIPHTLDEALPGGRGLLLVRSIAPKLRYERRGDLNRILIAFPL
jgi:serine/threonine-protein kinase RsbW